MYSPSPKQWPADTRKEWLSDLRRPGIPEVHQYPGDDDGVPDADRASPAIHGAKSFSRDAGVGPLPTTILTPPAASRVNSGVAAAAFVASRSFVRAARAAVASLAVTV